MKERGILFSAPMVRALLNGSKTQTRRAVKPDLRDGLDFMGGGPDVDPDEGAGVDLRWGEMQFDDSGDSGKPQWLACCADYPEEGFIEIGTGYGNVGDRLWVRETWAGPLVDHEVSERPGFDWAAYRKPEFCRYAADGGPRPEFMDADDNLVCRWTPGIHMFRWASRITLEIVSVRVERLQDISEADARAEGVEPIATHDRPGAIATCYGAYRLLWESINGAGSWAANPWVWCVEFRRLP